MKKIAIFTSGEGKAATRLASLFNEGNRIRVELVLSDQVPCRIVDDMMSRGINAVSLPRVIWDSNPGEILTLLRDNGVELIALDDFTGGVPPTIAGSYEGRIVTLTSPEDAPMEVVAALSGHGDNPTCPAEGAGNAESQPERQASAAVSPDAGQDDGKAASSKTVDEEWAETLKMNFDPSQVRQLPPPIPQADMAGHGAAGATHMPHGFTGSINHGAGGFPQPQHSGGEPMPSTYLVWSVVCTVLCCFIPGIVAIIFSSQVSSRYYSGDIEGAKKASRNAEIWIIVSFVLGLLSATLYFPVMLFAS